MTDEEHAREFVVLQLALIRESRRLEAAAGRGETLDFAPIQAIGEKLVEHVEGAARWARGPMI